MAPKNQTPPVPRTPLSAATPGLAAPTQTSGSETTLFLDIDLKNGAPPMTMVYLPGPLPAGALDLIVYLPGHKTASLEGVALGGMAIDQFITLKTFDFRTMIRGTGKKAFALVIPTLGNTSQAGDLVASGANFDLFLNMVLAGVGKHLPGATAAPTLGNLILAAHSGGGDPLFKVATQARTDNGVRGKIREVWCFDCTYSHGDDWLPMLPDFTGKGGPKNPLPGLVKLWVVSTGMNPASKKVRPDMKKPADPDTNPETEKRYDSGTGDNAREILDYVQRNAKAGKPQTTTVSVFHGGLLHWDKTKNKSATDVNYTGYTKSAGHNQCVGENLPALVTKSSVLK